MGRRQLEPKVRRQLQGFLDLVRPLVCHLRAEPNR